MLNDNAETIAEILSRLKLAQDRDQHDMLMSQLAAIASENIEVITRLYESDASYRQPLIWCLIGQTSKQAMNLFSKAIKDRDQYTRWSAAEALSKFRTLEASNLLVEALKDRSYLVKAIAVRSMSKFRNQGAIPQLEKIVASNHLRRNAPGIVSDAKKALSACRKARKH